MRENSPSPPPAAPPATTTNTTDTTVLPGTDTGAPASTYQGLQQVTIAVLGARGVGKTSIIDQFVGGRLFGPQDDPNRKHNYYYPSILINNHLYEIKLVDCPAISYFPMTTLTEWTDFRGYCLRSATAYILVFDITNAESFQYIRSVREQIIRSRCGPSSTSNGSSGSGGGGGSNNYSSHVDIPMAIVANKHDLPENPRLGKREVANMVKKQWKCPYIECSAKHNWHIVNVFKELMKEVDLIDHNAQQRNSSERGQNSRSKCVIL